MGVRFGDLPASAQERVERQRGSGVAGSLLSAPAAAALRSAGLVPVGEVFGCVAMHLGWSNNACGIAGGAGWSAAGWSWTSPVTVTGGTRRSWGDGFAPYVLAFESAWDGALGRMTAEARELGAEGVVGVRIGRSHLDGQVWEFSALGTAVITEGRPRRRPNTGIDPWTADLTAEDCAAAILSGRVPAGIAMGISVATKHEDQRDQQQRTSWSNQEVAGQTQLVIAARADARSRLAKRAGSGELVVTRMGLSEFETECGERERDLHAEAFACGTVLRRTASAPFRTATRPGGAAVLPVIPLTDATARATARRL